MTDNEIVKALECCAKNNCTYDCPFYYDSCIKCKYSSSEIIKFAFDLINRQQAEIEKFTKRQKPTGASGYKIVNGKVVFFTNMLGGCRHEYENLDEVAKTLNELLQECYSKDEIAFALKCKTEDLKTAKSEAIKEFEEAVFTLFPSDKNFTTISRFTIKQIAKDLTESVNYGSSKITEGNG